jgi:hypothetical protein
MHAAQVERKHSADAGERDRQHHDDRCPQRAERDPQQHEDEADGDGNQQQEVGPAAGLATA